MEDFLIATKKQRRSVAKFLLPTFYIAIIQCLGVLEARVINAAYPYVASRVSMGPQVANKFIRHVLESNCNLLTSFVVDFSTVRF